MSEKRAPETAEVDPLEIYLHGLFSVGEREAERHKANSAKRACVCRSAFHGALGIRL